LCEIGEFAGLLLPAGELPPKQVIYSTRYVAKGTLFVLKGLVFLLVGLLWYSEQGFGGSWERSPHCLLQVIENTSGDARNELPPPFGASLAAVQAEIPQQGLPLLFLLTTSICPLNLSALWARL